MSGSLHSDDVCSSPVNQPHSCTWLPDRQHGCKSPGFPIRNKSISLKERDRDPFSQENPSPRLRSLWEEADLVSPWQSGIKNTTTKHQAHWDPKQDI